MPVEQESSREFFGSLRERVLSRAPFIKQRGGPEKILAPQPNFSGLVELRDVMSVFERVAACNAPEAEVRLQQLRGAYDNLQSFDEKQSFLRFCTDQEIIDMGIANDVPELVQRFPNLRY